MPQHNINKFKFPEVWEGDRPPDGSGDSSFGQIFNEVLEKTEQYGKFFNSVLNPVQGFMQDITGNNNRGDEQRKSYIKDVAIPVFETPGKTLLEGIDLFGKNPIAGGLKVIESMGHLLATPFAALDKELRYHGLETEANIIAYPFEKAAEGVIAGENLIQSGLEQIPGYTPEIGYEATRMAMIVLGVKPEVAYSYDNGKLEEIRNNLSSITQIGSQFVLGGVLHAGIKGGKQIGTKFQKKPSVNIDPLGKEGRLGLGVEETALVKQNQQRPFIATETGSITKTLTKNEQIRLGEIKLSRETLITEKVNLNETIKFNRQKIKDLKGKAGKDIKTERERLKKNTKEAIEQRIVLDEMVDFRNKEIDAYLQEGELKHIKGLIPEKGTSTKLPDVGRGENVPTDIDFTAGVEPGPKFFRFETDPITGKKTKIERKVTEDRSFDADQRTLGVKRSVHDYLRDRSLQLFPEKFVGKEFDAGILRDILDVATENGVRGKMLNFLRVEAIKRGRAKEFSDAYKEATAQKPVDVKQTPKKEITIKREVQPEVTDKSSEVTQREVFDYQNTNAEPLISGQRYPNSQLIRFQLEGAGDILREFSKYEDGFVSQQYIFEKLNRIKKYLENKDGVFSHPDDSYTTFIKENKEVVDKLIDVYENQPVRTEGQALAKDLTLAIAKGKFEKASKLEQKIRNNIDKLEEANKVTGVSRESALGDSEINQRVDAKTNLRDKSSGQLNIGIDPTALIDMAKIGAELTAKGFKSFGKWADEMKKTYGEEVSPHLIKLWEMSKIVIKETEQRKRGSGQKPVEKFATEKEITEYHEIYTKRNSTLNKSKESIEETGKSIQKFGRQKLKPLDTRLKEIDHALYRTIKLNDHIKETKMRTEEEIVSGLVKPKGKSLNKTLDAKGRSKLDINMKQENLVEIKKTFKEIGLTKEFNVVNNLLQKIAEELGIEKKAFYFPRMVNNYKKYAIEVYKVLDKEPVIKGILNRVLDEYQSRKGKEKLTIEEESHIINNFIRGYIPGIKLSKFANELARVVEKVDINAAQYLHNWENSLMMYVAESRMKIENRRLLGKKSGEVPEISDKSVGRLIAEKQLESSKPFEIEEFAEITQILKAGIEPTGVPAFANLIKDVGYMTTLFNYFGSITQLGDIYAPLYRTPLGTLKAGVRMATGTSAIKNLRRIGIDINQMGREFTNPRQRSQLARFFGKSSLFRWADSGMKRLAVNTYYELYRGLAKQDKLVEGHPEYHRFKLRFGDKADEVINEFKTTSRGELTSRMAFQMWDELDAHQPISRWSLPEGYHTSAAMQLGYQMKTFSLRRADFILNESVRVMRDKNLSKAERIQGVKNFFYIMTAILASEQATGLTKEFIKNLMKQGKFDLGKAFAETYANPDMQTNILVDNLMGIVLLSRYDLKTMERDGIVSALVSKILPITSLPDNFYKDMIGGTFPKHTIKNVPLVGTTIYEWFLESIKGGGGSGLNFNMPGLPGLPN